MPLVIYYSVLLVMQVHIWDFSGQTTQLFMNDKVRLPNDSHGQPGKEVVADSSFSVFFLYNFAAEIEFVVVQQGTSCLFS